MSESDVPELTPAPEPEPALPAPKSSSSLKTVLIILGGLGCLGVLGAGGCGLLVWMAVKKTLPYTEVVVKQTTAIQAGDYETAYGLMSDSYRAEYNLPAFKQFWTENPKYFPPSAVSITGIQAGTGKNTSVTGMLIGPSSNTESIRYEFVGKEPNLKIVAISIVDGPKTQGFGFALDTECKIDKREDLPPKQEKVYIKVGSSGMKTGGDGKANLALSIRLETPAGQQVLEKKSLVEYTDAPKTLRMNWTVTLTVPKPAAEGEYTLHVTVEDKVARTETTQAYPLVLKQ